MAHKVFVNFPVNSANRAKEFYEALGFTYNPMFSSDDTAGMALSDTIFLMLLENDRFASFTSKTIIDAKTSTEVLNAISVESRSDVDEWVENAIAAGGYEVGEAKDYGFMYTRCLSDPDHHTWDIVWMNPASQLEPEA